MSPSAGTEGSQPAGRLTVGKDWLRLDDGEAVEAAWAALGDVYDPELGLDVVSLGLVYEVTAHDGRVYVEMTLTTPGCPVSESLPQQARDAVVDATGGMTAVEVQVVWDPPWDPQMMNYEAASALGFR